MKIWTLEKTVGGIYQMNIRVQLPTRKTSLQLPPPQRVGDSSIFLRTKTRCLEENEEKHGRKENLERKKKIK